MTQSSTEVRNGERGAATLIFTVVLLVVLAGLIVAVINIRPAG
jgi:hypothetical protein